MLISALQRAKIIEKIAFLLKDREAEIIKANKKDLGCAYNLSAPLKSRLELTSSKLSSLAEGSLLYTIPNTYMYPWLPLEATCVQVYPLFPAHSMSKKSLRIYEKSKIPFSYMLYALSLIHI